MSDDSHTPTGRRWSVQLVIDSDLKPTPLAMMVNMLPGVRDAYIQSSVKLDAEGQASVSDLATATLEATTPPLKSALNPLPKDNQIDDLLAKLISPFDTSDLPPGVKLATPNLKLTEAKAALATAIREAMPSRAISQEGRTLIELAEALHKDKNINKVFQPEGFNEAIDQFVEALRELGINL